MERIEVAERVLVARTAPTPVPWATLAEHEGLSARSLQRLVERYTRDRRLVDQPTEIVDSALAVYGQTISELSEAAANADGTSGLVGALRLMLEVVRARLELLLATGRLPRDFAGYEDREDAMVLIKRMAEVIERHGLPEAIIDELLEVVDRHAVAPSLPAERDSALMG